VSVPNPQAAKRRDWWRAAVGYEVYLRSFADGDGDGVGDLRGLLAHLEHLAWLGIDLVWITPFYPSPMADHGYDITDHCEVDPRYGTLGDLDAVIAAAHELGMRVVIDLVANHTSDQHPWFRASLAELHGSYRGYYLWRDGDADGGPPNNWVSYFGGPAWSRDPSSGQWWAHLFLPQQPDLDWSSPHVAAAFDRIVDFWLRRAVDGFRIDVAQGLSKHASLADNPRRSDPMPDDGPRQAFERFEHRYDIGQPENVAIFERWRALTEPYDAVLIGEVYLEPEAIGPYLRGHGLDLAFSFAFVDLPWDATAVSDALRATLRHLGPGSCWTQASHDEPRPPTRFGAGAVGRARALAITTLLAGMPGPLVLYQGEELGLEDGAVPADAAVDPMGGRDGCRTPIPWSTGPAWGFTTGRPWLPMDSWTASDTVEAQRDDSSSSLHRHRALLSTRRRIDQDAPVTWLGGSSIVAYRRADHLVAACVSDEPEVLEVPSGTWAIVFSTHATRRSTEVAGPSIGLRPAEAVILERRPAGSRSG